MRTDLRSLINNVLSLAAAARTASANGASVDTASHTSVTVLVQPGTITDGDHTPTLEESDVSGSGFTTVAAEDLIGSFSDLVTDTNQEVAYIGAKRFVRAVSSVSGASTGGVYAISILLGNAQKAPI